LSRLRDDVPASIEPNFIALGTLGSVGTGEGKGFGKVSTRAFVEGAISAFV